MAKLVFGAVLLLGLINVSLPLHAQGSVNLFVCNAGKADVDAILLRAGRVSSSHIGPADCATVAETVGGMEPTYVGFAFADSHGQWGSARRMDIMPAFGSGVLTAANQNASVQHGSQSVAVQLQLLFRPPSPTCNTHQAYSEQANLPSNASPGQRNAAAIADRGRSTDTTCQTLNFTFNVEAFSDSREITFRKECDPCDKKAEAKLTPEERAARQRQEDIVNQAQGELSKLGSVGAFYGSVVDQQKREAQQEQIARESRLSPTQPMNWSDLLPALRNKRPSQNLWDLVPRNIIIRGTIASVEVSQDTFESNVQWVDIAFRESPVTDVGPNRRPYSEFNVCTSNQDLLRDVFGANFHTSMIGKTIEVEGETQGVYCRGLRGSIRVTLAHQIRPVQSAQFAPGTVPKFVQPAAKQATPAASAGAGAGSEQEVDAANKYVQDLETKRRKTNECVAQSEQYAKTHPLLEDIQREYYACLNAIDHPAAPGAVPAQPTAPAKTAPAPTVAAPDPAAAAARAKAEQEQREQIAQQQAAAQKQREAEIQKAQKTVACTQQVMKDYTDGGRSDPAGLQKALLACAQPE